jgi:glycosyltransferase involved in cell wall biosynthesis
VLPEVPQAHVAPALYGLARYSGNELALVGYDMIPVVSPNAVVPQEIEKFAAYLSIVKHADRVVGISDDAAAEFAGFASTLASQGLAGPVCSSAPLPIDTPGGELPDSGRDGARPLVLCVGSQEPRKNHGAVLFASEMLWREGLDFELVFIGGGSSLYTRAFDRKVEALRRAGRAVSVRRGVADRELVEAYRAARFTVFPSIHEGYGLPVAESLALGTPVVTTSYGPTGDIAADGGCLTVNPRSDASIMDAMRLLLTDDAEVQRLRDEIRQRPTRSWDDYARESWAQLVGAGARG